MASRQPLRLAAGFGVSGVSSVEIWNARAAFVPYRSVSVRAGYPLDGQVDGFPGKKNQIGDPVFSCPHNQVTTKSGNASMIATLFDRKRGQSCIPVGVNSGSEGQLDYSNRTVERRQLKIE